MTPSLEAVRRGLDKSIAAHDAEEASAAASSGAAALLLQPWVEGGMLFANCVRDIGEIEEGIVATIYVSAVLYTHTHTHTHSSTERITLAGGTNTQHL